MQTPPVEPYPNWSLADQLAGKYEFGSKVSYTDTETKETKGYRANAQYFGGPLPPPSNGGWSVDLTYAVEWSPSKKYKIGDKVWHEVGDPTRYSKYYLYVASPRYFGGSAPPNEEEDTDGIRTWELYSEQNGYGIIGTTFTIPMMKKSGHLGGIGAAGELLYGSETFNYNNLEPDGYPYQNYTGETGDNPPPMESPVRISSVLEGGPYDENVYEFWYYDSNGKKKNHRKKGVHRGQLVKELRPSKYSKEIIAVAERQWLFTNYGQSGSDNPYPLLAGYRYVYLENSQSFYSSNYGFSIEMWQYTTPSNVELVTRSVKISKRSSGFSTDNKFQILLLTSGNSAMGYDKDPNTEVETSAIVGEILSYVSMNCPTFHDRNITISFIITENSWYWKPVETEAGYPIWEKVTNKPRYSQRSLTLNTKDYSYKHNLPQQWLASKMKYSAGPRTIISLSQIGWSFE